MSTAVYPIGMRPFPSSGYTHNSAMSNQYITWKGTGLSKAPTGITAGTMRPLTNKDYGNNYPAPFGKARPIKHARKGSMPFVNPQNVAIITTQSEYQEVDRNLNRNVRSSVPNYLISQLIDNPGGYMVKENTLSTETPNCGGVCMTASLYPNIPYLTQNPERSTTSPTFCCNEEKKARRRARPASTNISKKYYTRHAEYMENRCQTFDQRSFNFVRESFGNPQAKPGAPDANNYYVPNCYCPSTPSNCGRVYYKPNNYQFATQGAVSSSTLNLRLNKNTIDTNLANLPENEIIYKNKAEPCKPAYYLKNGNATSCHVIKTTATLNANNV